MYSNEMIKKLYRVSLAALVIGLGTAAISPAQALLPAGSPNVTGPTPLNQPAPATNANEASQIPDEIALFDTEVDIPTPGSGMITPNNGSDAATPRLLTIWRRKRHRVLTAIICQLPDKMPAAVCRRHSPYPLRQQPLLRQ